MKIEKLHHDVLHKISERPSENLGTLFEDAGYPYDYHNGDVGEEPYILKGNISDITDQELAEIITEYYAL